ncbi:SDR family oxidoreductase [Leucothrix arctica]|uniref:3-oxoacyl-ACP reductase n=1 Tax=Leucothrix arctica TaxID=1481894 RepID=A0A317CPK1_9GAMM|nr:SDR family oxidoreductase [Leucothrix arctica]PWQ98300.1 3-oxoacyl-ACP reductase [Leucothrix arctica]
MDLKLKDKVIMVAAASSGMGYAIAERCAMEGAIVSICSRRTDVIEAAAQSIQQKTGATVKAYTVDASKNDDIKNWVDGTVADLGSPAGILINAGGPPPGQFDDFDDEAWNAAFNLTLMSAIRMAREVLPHMRKQGYGSILTLTSSSVKEPISNLILSNVMRSGVTSLVKSLSKQLAGENIRVNNIIPGRIDTPRVQGMDAKAAANKGITPEEQAAISKQSIPAGRYGEPEEFANVAVFLLSDSASYVTGSTLVVDGGMTSSLF